MKFLGFLFLFVTGILAEGATLKQPHPHCSAFGKYDPIEGRYLDGFRNQITNELKKVPHRKRELEDVRSISIPSVPLSRRVTRPPHGSRPAYSLSDSGFSYSYSDADLDRLEHQPLRPLEIYGSGLDRSRRPSLLQTISAGFCGWASYCPTPVRKVGKGVMAASSWVSILFQNTMTFWFYANDEQQRKDKIMMLLTAYVVAGTILFTNLYSVWNNNRPKLPDKFAISMEVYHRDGVLPPYTPQPRFIVDEYNIDGSGQFTMTGHRDVPIPQVKGWLQYSSIPQPSNPPPLARRDGKYDDFCAPDSWDEWKTVLGLAFLEVVIPMMRDGFTTVTLALAHWGRRNDLKVSHGGQTLVRWWLSTHFDPRDFHILRNDPPPDFADLHVTPSAENVSHQECFEFFKPPEAQSRYDAGPPPAFWRSFTAECENFNNDRSHESSSKPFSHSEFGWKAEYFDDGCKEPINCQRMTGMNSDAGRSESGEIAALIKTCSDRASGGDGLFHGGLIEHNIGADERSFNSCGVIRIRPQSN